jgi:hypothetical protein
MLDHDADSYQKISRAAACTDPKSGFQSCSPLVLVDESAEDIVATEVRGTDVFHWRQAVGWRKVEAPMSPRRL